MSIVLLKMIHNHQQGEEIRYSVFSVVSGLHPFLSTQTLGKPLIDLTEHKFDQETNKRYCTNHQELNEMENGYHRRTLNK